MADCVCWHKRRMQFTAGPQRLIFYACPACSPDLTAGRVSCFQAIRDTPAMPVNLDKIQDEHCALCGVAASAYDDTDTDGDGD